MHDLAASEFDLVTLTRAIVGLGDPSPALIRSGRPLTDPSPACAEALRETLAKGCVLRLARGGWRRQDRVNDGKRASGRLWQRHEPPALHFTEVTEKMLRWMTTSTLVAKPPALRGRGPQTPADELVFYAALAAASEAHCGDAVARQTPFRRSALCWLGFPDLLARGFKGAEPALPSFTELAASGWLIEALESELIERWVTLEEEKSQVAAATEMNRLGSVQTRLLAAYFKAIDAAGRRDLARFAIGAGARLVSGAPSSAAWLGSLERTTKLSSREEARRSAAAFLRSLETLGGWANAAASAHFIDDDYAASQIYLEIWETLGPQNLATARALVAEMTSIGGLIGDGAEGARGGETT